MASREELIARYREYSTMELLEVYIKRDQYAAEGKVAIEQVVSERGGAQQLQAQLQLEANQLIEKKQIMQVVTNLLESKQYTEAFIQRVDPQYLSMEQVKAAIAEAKADFETQYADQQREQNPLRGAFIGGGVSAVVGGLVWGFQMVYSGQIMPIFGVGLLVFSYGLITFFTNQSYRNPVVWIGTLLAVGLALGLGFALYEVMGYQGPLR